MLRTIANILWHVPFLGFLTALLSFLLGSLLTILVIPAPIGLGLIQLSKFQLAPFSYSLVSKDDLGVEQSPVWATYSFIIRILYLPIGCIMALCAIVQIVGLVCSIVGIPVALVVAKALGTYFNPVSKVCVPVSVSQMIDRQKTETTLRDYQR